MSRDCRPSDPAPCLIHDETEASDGEAFTAEDQEVEGEQQQVSARALGLQEEGRQALRRQPAEVLSPAAEIREHLAAARAAGVAFDEAWDQAVAAGLGPEPHPRASAQRRDRAEWIYALRWSRAAFEDAYHRVPESRREAAARDLEELIPA